MGDEQIITVQNHMYFSASSKVTIKLAMPPGNVAYVTFWWVPRDVRAYDVNMIQKSIMITESIASITLDIPATDAQNFGSSEVHGQLGLGFRAISTTDKKDVPNVSFAIEAELTSCEGRVSYPGCHTFDRKHALDCAKDTLVNWSKPYKI